MRKIISICFFFVILSPFAQAQPNCLAYKYYGDTLKYQACLIGEEAYDLYQFSKEFHEIFDRAIEVCPEYDYAYRSKSVSYLKSGDFINWKILMDKAVELNPIEHLGYRGWCQFQFFRDYENAIKDLEKLDSLLPYDIGYSKNGNYHLQVARALCYKAIGQTQKAIGIIETQLTAKDYSASLFDYLHLGVLYLDQKEYAKAEAAFKRQSIENELAENQYYLGLLYQRTGEITEAVKCLEKAHQLYLKEQFLYDTYTHPIDKVYLKEIKEALKNIRTDD